MNAPRFTRSARTALIACTLAFAAAGCAQTGADTGAAPGSGGLGAAPPTGGPTAPPPDGTPSPAKSPAKSPTASTSTPTGPQIVYLRVKQQPQCPQGTNVAPIPGVPLVVEWKATGADRLALSVDNPGLVGSYGTYDIEGTETFTFGCGGAPGTVEKHVYTVHTVGRGTQRSKSLTVEATVYEIGQV